MSSIVISYDDGWRAADPAHRLPETWKGEVVFELAACMPTNSTPLPGSGSPPSDPRATHHDAPRNQHYHSATDAGGGPDILALEGKRVTGKVLDDRSDCHMKDSWKGEGNAETTDTPWTGRTVFYDGGFCPQVYERDIAEESRVPREALIPKEPMQEERESHSLMHAFVLCAYSAAQLPQAAVWPTTATQGRLLFSRRQRH